MKRIFYPMAMATLLGFFGILYYYQQEPVRELDERAALLFGGMEWLKAMSFIGEQWMIFAVSFLLLVFLWAFRHNYRGMFFVFLAVGAGNALNQLLQQWFGRPMPDFPEEVASYSFPSDHAMVGLLYLFTLAYFLSERAGARSIRLAVWLAAVLLTFLAALSQVASGAHFLSDVLAGLFLGYTLFVLVAIWYEMRERQFRKRQYLRAAEQEGMGER
ncbi:phosphatase PAP2 family protein [Planococcus sp. CP5-4]|uniref:phosphatase PAP2 family protein n=1 Tax=unclassified Planococcus (in: firmicutes) TaxID=2662419 RepID=UPI001C24CAF2|nr:MULTISPECIES: phosphatase PAP2 family protein [unclassified Planococcus (in: firmicutes)]MBU9672358.1 phosphatase PAP2 family protein [Planococcus sp. CP5-4_YE]MBV0909409.1 phosphatase PAP2 family protein [Planococcus sp. CP5-4_UN]MBW6064138.1 phosphatase PAP2 family protein [Planococcus sp. CP5-4]